MTRWIATLALPLSLLFIACDAEPVDERSDESPLAVAEEAPEPAQADELNPNSDQERRSAKRGRKGPAERLCAAIECTDAQATAIGDLFAKGRPAKAERKAHREAAKAEGAEHRSALAAAFREGTLRADAIGRPSTGKPKTKHGETLVGLHALLTPDQREQVADMLAERGPKLFGPKHGRKGERGGEGKRHRKGKRGGEGMHTGEDKHAGEGRRGRRGEHGEHGKRGQHHLDDGAPLASRGEADTKPSKYGKKIDQLCSKVECTDQQRTALLAKAAELHPKPSKEEREAKKAQRSRAHAALATAFRGDTFSATDLETLSPERQAKRDAKSQTKGEILLALQEVLTVEQRALVADMLAERGVHGVLGGKHGKHGKHGKRRGHEPRDRHDRDTATDHA